jgi:lipopolysaccharide assembly outer membrane protein LptD (OstA)
VLKNKRLFFLLTFFVYQSSASDLVDEGILSMNSQNNSCLVSQPFLGIVEDIESLDVKSDKFEITDEKVLILNGNVEIDFPDGFLRSGKARVDQDKGLVDFKKNGDLFLQDYFFRAGEGSFNKDKLSIKLSKGETFLNDRGLVINFDSLEGNIENEINLNQVSMTSCSNVSSGWELVAEKIVLNDESKRGYAKNVKIKAFDKTIIRLPAIPFATSKDRMSGFLQ